MRLDGWKRRLPVFGVTAFLLAGALGLAPACSGAAGDSCEEDADCADDELCEPEEGVCVAQSELQCDDHDDCTDDRLCSPDGYCVDQSNFTCELNSHCPDDEYCDDGDCVVDEIEDEDYRVSFAAEDTMDDSETFRIVDSEGELSEQFDTGDVDCQQARFCAVTDSESHLLVVEQTDETQEVSAATLSGDPPAVDGDPEVIASDVENVRVRGDGIAYARVEDSQYVAYYRPVDGEEQEIAQLHSVMGDQLSHYWDVHPDKNVAVQFAPPGLQSLDVLIGSMDEPLTYGDDMVYHFDGDATGGGIGSIYLTSIPSTISDDGRLVAFQANTPAEYEYCTEDSDCSDAGHRCGAENRCYALEPQVHVIDRDNTDELGEGCLGHDECSPYHRCDSGAEDFDGGRCAPGRISVGIDNRSNGCEATRDDGSFRFTDINGPVNFGPDGRIYFVGERDCVRRQGDAETEVEANIPRTAIIAAEPDTGEHHQIFGSIYDGEGDYGGEHGPDDDVDHNFDYNAMDCGESATDYDASTQCVTYIDEVRISPEGNDLVYRASNPFASTNLADSMFDIWKVTRDTSRFRLIGGIGSTSSADSEVRVHAP